MAKKAACRCKHAECEECPEWIFTFADLVMLMMGFFVILWVLKPNPNPKTSSPTPSEYTDLVKAEASIREAFGYEPHAGSADPVTQYMMLQRANQIKVPQGPGKGAKTTDTPMTPPGSDPEPSAIRPGPQAMMGGRLQFDVADDKLTPNTQRTLDAVAEQVKGHRNLVLIKGHTALDDLPESATAAQLMSLSIRRAEVVADYLTNAGVAPELLRIQGCSTFEPVAVRDYDPNAQTTNRRVEVYTTPTLVTDLQGKPGDAVKKSTTQPMAK
jgi:outer membrane protein OmpA-like peptidoglycan-associated protein